MKRGFWERIWLSFLATSGPPVTIFAFIVTVLLWILAPDVTVSARYAAPVAILLLYIIIVLCHAVYTANGNPLPKILVVKSRTPGDEGMLLCVLEPSDLFSYNSLVSFYRLEKDFEQFMGWGSVINIQEDGKIQVVMNRYTLDDAELLGRFSQNNRDTISEILIKPSVPRDIFNI